MLGHVSRDLRGLFWPRHPHHAVRYQPLARIRKRGAEALGLADEKMNEIEWCSLARQHGGVLQDAAHRELVERKQLRDIRRHADQARALARRIAELLEKRRSRITRRGHPLFPVSRSAPE